VTTAQPKLIPDGAPQVTKAKGLQIRHLCTGQYVTGSIALDQPNPFGRSHCQIKFTVRSLWLEANPAIIEEAVGVAAHWFRDIGGLRIVQQRQAFQIAKLLLTDGGPTTAQLHDAVTAYAANRMCRQHKSWKALDAWLRGGDWQRWLDYAEAEQREARIAADKKTQLAEYKHGRAQDARKRKEQDRDRQAAQDREAADKARQRAAKEAEARTRAEEAQLDRFHAHPPEIQRAALERVSKDLRRPIPADLATDPEFRSLAVTRAQIIAHRRRQRPSGAPNVADALFDGRCSGLASSPQPPAPP